LFLEEGHVCNLPVYEAAYDAFAVDPAVIAGESITYDTLFVTDGDTEHIEVVSQVENTPWASRLPHATPVDFVQQTPYSVETGWSVPSYQIHTVAPQTSAFTASSTLVVPHENPPSFVVDSVEPIGEHFYRTHFHISEILRVQKSYTDYDRSYTVYDIPSVSCMSAIPPFIGTRAFSGSVNDGFGGALLIVQSQLLVDDDTGFHACQAMSAGAITCIDTDATLFCADAPLSLSAGRL
jgi:hypothetical protein